MRNASGLKRHLCAPLVLGLGLGLGLAACAPKPAPIAPTPAPQVSPVVTEAPVAPTPAADPTAIKLGHMKAMTSPIMGEERKLVVYVPPGYEQNSQNYPVIYLLDGPGHFHHVSGIVSFLSNQGRMPGAIIVGIANTDRTRDLTPSNEKRAPTSGGADKFLDFIEKELMPSIEGEYRTTGYNVLIGHSFGGLTAVHALLSRPGLFDAHIAASPSLQWDDQLMAKRAAPMFAAGKLSTGFLYYTLGSEQEGITAGNRDFAALLTKSAPKGFQWKFDHLEAEDHGSVVHRTVYNGLEMLFADFTKLRNAANADQLKAMTKTLSERFKVPAQVPEATVNILGYRQMQQKNVAGAKSLFEMNIENYPNSANVYDSLGELLESTGDLKGALVNYEKAVSLSKPSDQNHAAFKVNRDRAKKAVSGQ